jgi:hypothetical protein
MEIKKEHKKHIEKVLTMMPFGIRTAESTVRATIRNTAVIHITSDNHKFFSFSKLMSTASTRKFNIDSKKQATKQRRLFAVGQDNLEIPTC